MECRGFAVDAEWVTAMVAEWLGDGYGGWVWLSFGTGEGLLWYGICVPCSKQASWGTRRIFRGIRCKKQAFPVRKEYSVLRTASCGTRRIMDIRYSPPLSGTEQITRC